MYGFLSVIMLATDPKAKANAPFLYTRKLLNVAEIVEMAEGRQLHDAEMNRDFETVYIVGKDGAEFEIDATFDLVEKALYGLTEGAVAKIDPMANDAVNEPIDGTKIGEAETISSEREGEAAAVGGEEITQGDMTIVPGGGGRNRARR